MPLIELTTAIRAPIERCFDLARSIDFHIATARSTQESVVRGRTSGLIGLGETVTWRARHLGVWQELTAKITLHERPFHSRDVMTQGAFASMTHDHLFSERDGVTIMTDRFQFESPLGPLGWLANRLFVERHMREFLTERANTLKAAAESEEWRPFLES